MPRRREALTTGEIYHIFNRGVEKRIVFAQSREYQRFILLLRFYQRSHSYQFSRLTHQERLDVIREAKGNPFIEIIGYCLMPNHFHLLVKQSMEDGISRLLRTITDAYVKYFNTLHGRVGPLFQGKFKTIRIEDNSQLLHISRYIHLNPFVSGIVEYPHNHQWSSYSEYLSNSGFCTKDIILGQFKSLNGYKDFVEDYRDYAKKLHRFEHLALEDIA